MDNLYKTDYTRWLGQQRELLENRQFDKLDIDNLLEAMDSEMGDTSNELRSHLRILLIHLLKYDYQKRVLKDPWVEDKVIYTWIPSINNPRGEIKEHLKRNPSLDPMTDEILSEAYYSAKPRATLELNKHIRIKEKRLNKNSFPEQCPWSFEQVTDDDWLPGD
ncbi:DUF29 domain-containing protein [Endozoicomonas sp. ISHI1]|uniref:DUF29 domain-containing protein n=1 Tax=Endozoicomonas sp. ISHI1 TaxID=2825882 RepID=UPI00214807D0|nr:DUF29 domain-containing protein [Endozoicomonas sp. ISHI1]